MNCIECQEDLSLYIDGELGGAESAAIQEHLGTCESCDRLCRDLSLLLSSCSFEETLGLETSEPPNPDALWRRINNVIETEVKPVQPQEPPRGRFSRIWQLSFSQAVTAFAAVAVISSLLTFVAVSNYSQPSDGEASESYFSIALAKLGLAETASEKRERRVEEQKRAIAYWNKRVQARRAVWDEQIREAFDRNLKVIDESVNEYTVILQQNPDDSLSSEMLDSVLNDKMNLLREFSEL